MYSGLSLGPLTATHRYSTPSPPYLLALLVGSTERSTAYTIHLCIFRVYGAPNDLNHWVILLRPLKSHLVEIHECMLTPVPAEEGGGFRYPMMYEVNAECDLDKHSRESWMSGPLAEFKGDSLNEVRCATLDPAAGSFTVTPVDFLAASLRHIIYSTPRGTRENLKSCHHWVLSALENLRCSPLVAWTDEQRTFEMREREEDERPLDHWGYTVWKLHDREGGDLADGEPFSSAQIQGFQQRLEEESAPAWAQYLADLNAANPRMIAYEKNLQAWEATHGEME